MLTTYIYSLSDPRTDEIRYVGKTINLKLRIKEHRRLNLLRHSNTYKGNWLLSLYKLGLSPIVNILEIVVGDAWGQRERWWINHLKFQCRLTNYSLGGEGNPGRVRSDDEKRRWREKVKGRPLPAEQRKKIGEGLKKHYATTSRPPMTQEQKDRISKTLTGRPGHKQSLESRAKVSASIRAFDAANPGKRIAHLQKRKGIPNPNCSRAVKAHWATLTEEQKAARRRAISEGKLKAFRVAKGS